MREPTQSEIINSVNQGIIKAQEDYREAYMSNISSGYAPEYLMTVYIFQSILELKRKCNYPYGLSLEEPVYEVARALGVRGRFPRDARVSGYCDLLLRDIHDKPRVVIEIKKDAWDYWHDLARLAYLVSRGLEFGIFASCWFEEVKDNNRREAEDRVREEIQCIEEHISDDIRRRYSRVFMKTKFGDTERLVLEGEVARHEEFVWCPVCFVVCREGEVANTPRQY
jgi:hypothetical protein